MNGYNPDVRSITVARSNSLRRASPLQQRRYVPDYPTLPEDEQPHDRSYQGRPPHYDREPERYRGDPRQDPRDNNRYSNDQRRDVRDPRDRQDPRDYHRDPRDYRDHPDRDGPHSYRDGTLDRRSDDHNRSHNSSFDNRDMFHPKQAHFDGRGQQYPYDHNQMPVNGNSMHHPDRSPRHHGDSSPHGLPKNTAGLQYDRVSSIFDHVYAWSKVFKRFFKFEKIEYASFCFFKC